MRGIFRRALVILLLTGAVGLALPGLVHAQPPRPAPAQDGFVPVDQLPPQDQVPAAPLVIAAYAVVWIAVFGYLWSIWQRLGRVEHEIAEARRRVDAGSRK